jgi:hypothetical protein
MNSKSGRLIITRLMVVVAGEKNHAVGQFFDNKPGKLDYFLFAVTISF